MSSRRVCFFVFFSSKSLPSTLNLVQKFRLGFKLVMFYYVSPSSVFLEPSFIPSFMLKLGLKSSIIQPLMFYSISLNSISLNREEALPDLLDTIYDPDDEDNEAVGEGETPDYD